MRYSGLLKIVFYTAIWIIIDSSSSNGQLPDSVETNLKFTYQTVPVFSRNIDRIDLIAHYKIDDGYMINHTNIHIKKYCDSKFQSIENVSVSQMYNDLNADLQIANNAVLNGIDKQNFYDSEQRDLVYSLASVKLFSSQTELEMKENVRSISRDFISMGYDNFENDFMPFIGRILAEHRLVFYQDNRVRAFDAGAYGVVSAMDIINVHRIPDSKLVAGVCRDASEFALRIMRQSFDVYFNEVQNKNYDVDDYLFLQAWMTPVSQHVTVLMIDPENTRNGYDLDWGRVYKREAQEGLETPNNLGTEIRLWKFDPDKNHTVPLLILKTDKGRLLDEYSLTRQEYESFNSVYYKTYYSDLKYEKQINKHYYWNAAAGKLNDNCYYMLSTIIRETRDLSIGKYINFNGKIVLQPHYYENGEVQSQLIPWKDWSSSHNLGLAGKYIAKITSQEIKISKSISFQLFSNTQISGLISASKFYNDDELDQERVYTTGDGNIYTTYGGRFVYTSPSSKINYNLTYQRRSYLMPKEVRLLSPDPVVLVKNGRLICAADNILSSFTYKFNNTGVSLNTIYEYDILNTQLIQNEISLFQQRPDKNNFSITVGFNRMLSGFDYYWYPLNKNYIRAGYSVLPYKTTLNVFMSDVKSYSSQFGVSVQKYF